MTPKVLYYVLFLITLPDVEAKEHLVHRIVFEKEENCLYHAKMFNQHKDPWVQKPNCVTVKAITAIQKSASLYASPSL